MNKKIISLALLSAVILCCGCTNDGRKITYNKETGRFEAEMEILANEIPEETVESIVSEKIELSFTEPEEESVEDNEPEIVLPEIRTLIINEVVVSEYGVNYDDTKDNYDWVELKNVSNDTINLSDYWISDKKDNPKKYNLPDRELQPNELIVFACDSKEHYSCKSTGFELNAEKEDLYLSDAKSFVDMAHLENIPLGGSYGRMQDEEGFFYFENPTPKKENKDGKTFVSKMPESKTQCGVFNDIESIDVELSGEGKIYYTLDGSMPTRESEIYTSPITIDKTTVVRAVAVQDGGLESKAITLPFIINENHTLPVVSVVTSSPRWFSSIFDSGDKHFEQPGNIVLFENGEAFNLDCGVNISGQSSRKEFPKKSIKIQFRSSYGKDNLEYDLFGNGEVKYESLSLRAGQDSAYRIFNSDMWQDLSYELNENIISQHTKPVILYVNGEYFGIYSLKENVCKSYYANIMGVSKDSVVECDVPLSMPDEFSDNIYDFIVENDMSLDENYEKICNELDIEEFIDYLLVEGLSANNDLVYNVKAFKSSEGDGKWRFVVYDLDGAVKVDGPWSVMFNNYTYGYHNKKLTKMLVALFENESFKDQFLKRYASVYSTVFSNENIKSVAEKYREIYMPEIERDRERWWYFVPQWNLDVDSIAEKIDGYDWQNYGVKHLCRDYLNMTKAEVNAYFPDVYSEETKSIEK